jgi:hypothetical protein
MRVALDDLQLERILVIYPGSKRYQIAPEIEAVPLQEVWQEPLLQTGP